MNSAGLPRMSPVGTSASLRGHATAALPTLAGSSTLLTVAAAAPSPASAADARVRPSLLARRTPSSSRDPHRVCRAHVDQLLELLGEQVDLAQAIRAALRLTSLKTDKGSSDVVGAVHEHQPASPHLSTPASVQHNAENVHPALRRGTERLSTGSSRSDRTHEFDTTSAAANSCPPSSSSAAEESVAQRVGRLRVLHEEATRFAAARCLPSLAELLSTFDAYWAWKASNGETGDVDALMQEQPNAGHHQHQRQPTLLRQRYEQVLRVRDELDSFLQLHGDAVRAIDVQLAQWQHDQAASSAATRKPEKRTRVHGEAGQQRTRCHEFESYICQLVEVAQATRHVAQLLQAALQALCSPAPRTASGTELSVHERLRQRDVVNVNAAAPSGAWKPTNRARLDPAEADTGLSAAFHAEPSPPHHSISSATHTPSPAATRVRSPLLHGNDNEDEDEDNTRDGSIAWADAVSPLTPPPPAAAAAAAVAASGSQTAAASPASPGPRPVEEESEASSRRHHWRSRWSHSTSHNGCGSVSQSPDAASPGVLDLAPMSVSPSMSTTAAVSVSPPTVQRRPATATSDVDAGDTAPLPSREVSEARASLHTSPSALEDRGITAAVSPVVDCTAAPQPVDMRAGASPRAGWHRSLRNGVRSLLGDLTAAEAVRPPTAAVDSDRAAVFVPPAQHQQQQRDPSRPGSDVQPAARGISASTSASPSPSPPMPSRERSVTLQSRSPLPTRTHATASERAGSGSSSSDGLGGDASVGRAASVPAVLWPRLAHTSHEPPDPADVQAAAAAGEAMKPSRNDAPPTLLSTAAATREVDSDFYTSRAHAAESRTCELAAESPTARASAAHVWEKTFSPAPLGLDEIEAELGATQERLELAANTTTTRQRSSRVAAAATTTEAAAADTESLASLEVSLHDAVQVELTALRAEQRHTLHRMHQDIRHTLAEIASTAAAVVASRSQSSHSRTSSRARSEGVQTGEMHEERHAAAQRADEGSAGDQETAARGRRTAAAQTAAPVPPPPSAPPAAPRSTAALQGQLVEAEARAARLEQQTLTLKKRLWVAEMLDTAVEGRRRSDETAAPQRRRRVLSLRDAFVFGPSRNADDAEDAGEEEVDLGDDAGAEAEAAAMAYLVDRQLGWREATRSRGGSVQPRGGEGHRAAHAARHSPQAPWLNTAASDGASPGGVWREGSQDAKYFDDDNNGGSGCIGVALRHLSSAASARSPWIRQKRASIFDLLRQGPPAPPGSSTTATSPAAPTATAAVPALTPPPPLRPLPDASLAKGVDGASAPRLHSHTTAPRGVVPPAASAELHRHPYSTSPISTTEARPASSSRAAPNATSQYYAAISSHGGGHADEARRGVPTSYTHPHVHRSDDGPRSPAAACSSLRAAQVLENARRLLQNRSAAIGAAQGSGAHAWGAEAENERGDLRRRSGEEVPSRAAAAPPGRWGEHVELHDGTSPSPRGASHEGVDQRETASVRPSPPSTRTRHDGSALRDEQIAGRGGRYRGAESPESVYHDYDTSPCAPVAYSASKLPRSSSERDAGTASPPARPHAQATTPPQHRRVDSATSPITRTSNDGDSDSLGGSGSTSEGTSSTSSSPIRAKVGESGRALARGMQQQQRRSRSSTATSRADSASSPHTTETHHTQRYRSPPSPSPEALRAARHSRHDRYRDGDASEARERDDAAGPAVSSSCSTSRRSASLASSHASAEKQLMDTLTDQASTLHAALQQLQEQQRQLREKHAQVQQAVKRAASARAPAAASILVHRGRGGGGGRRGVASAAGRRGSHGTHFRPSSGNNSSSDGEEAEAEAEAEAEDEAVIHSGGAGSRGGPAAAELHRLLGRFAMAESTLAEREQRIRHALRVVRRQRDALLRDDLL